MEMSKYRFTISIDFEEVDDAEARRYVNGINEAYSRALYIDALDASVSKKFQRIYKDKEPVKLEL